MRLARRVNGGAAPGDVADAGLGARCERGWRTRCGRRCAALAVTAALGLTLTAAFTPDAAHTLAASAPWTAARPAMVQPAAGTPPAAHGSHPFASQPTVSEGAIDADGNRLLAGADRYATSVLLASVPLNAGDAATRDVLVVSGESLVDAVSAVSVAAARDAAIVLTATDQVPQVVSEFITRRAFDTVTVGGGTAAVSDTTASELAALVNRGPSGAEIDDAPVGRSNGALNGGSSGGSDGAAGGSAGDASVSRVAGATRYETAVAAARAAGRPGEWCDSAYRGAMVVSGESLVDGVIAAPVAYAWRLPLLFTEPDALPEVVDEFLKGVANVRHVTVVGAPTDINQTVVDELARSNDIEVLHIDAATPAERSVELAEALEDCDTQPVAPGQYALLDANQPVDGVAAAAALAHGLGEHGTSETLIPVLAVNQNSLPQPVAEYLEDAGERHDTITLYPLGGVARLTPRVISSAVDAARGDTEDDTNNNAGGAAEVDVSDTALIAAGLTPGKSDGTGVAVGVGVVIEGGVMKLEAPAGRSPSREQHPGFAAHLIPDDALPVLDEWFASPGVLDPYMWQPEVEVLEAGVDHDGDGNLSADEKYPLGSPERAAYMIASGGQAPPGATVLAVPDMHTRGGGESGEGHRTTAERYPAGIPVPPGAPDRATSTFVERQLERKQRFEAYSGGRGFGRWADDFDEGYGPWRNGHYQNICSRTPEARPGSAPMGVPTSTDGVTCETAADWYLWMCDTMNDPAVKGLGYVGAWLETFDRFYDQWANQLPEPWLWRSNLEEQTVISPWQFELTSGQPRCTSNDDPANANSAANRAAHAARLRELAVWGSDNTLPFRLGTGNAAGPDSAWWKSPGNRLNVLADVTAAWRLTEHTSFCQRDVRYCSAGGLSQLRSLRALE